MQSLREWLIRFLDVLLPCLRSTHSPGVSCLEDARNSQSQKLLRLRRPGSSRGLIMSTDGYSRRPGCHKRAHQPPGRDLSRSLLLYLPRTIFQSFKIVLCSEDKARGRGGRLVLEVEVSSRIEILLRCVINVALLTHNHRSAWVISLRRGNVVWTNFWVTAKNDISTVVDKQIKSRLLLRVRFYVCG